MNVFSMMMMMMVNDDYDNYKLLYEQVLIRTCSLYFFSLIDLIDIDFC